MTQRKKNYLEACVVVILLIPIIWFVDAISTGIVLIVLGFSIFTSVAFFEISLLYKKNKEKEVDGKD
ncbi:hypothetical protein GCM10008931_02960 [Oceanobacillus oncorhynchi subsp. oncorhynchi]|uniref:hypothetical protein n=1 Tax=Oceanobacillus oncorhynchi TaxID=545501 RepID=UPI0031DCACF4